jgi:hypothetical protein
MRARGPCLLVLLAAFASTGPLSSAPGTMTYGPAAELCRFADPAIRESSGLVASRRQAGVLWTHNDSGDSARVFAVDRRGRTLATHTLAGVFALDWEDVAIGPGPAAARDYLYLGDIGDNGQIRPEIYVYRTPEPVVDASRTGVAAESADVQRFTLKYPDGPHNCETLLVHPKSGVLYLVTKEPAGMCFIYKCAALRPGETHTLTKVADLKPPDGRPNTTGGDISPDALRVVVCNYDTLWEFRASPGQPFDAVWRAKPLVLDMPIPGEAIAYSADGRALLISQEGTHAPIYELRQGSEAGDAGR